MKVMAIIEIVITVLCACGYAAMVYFKVKGNLIGMVSELIALAEQTGFAGSEKMKMVVGQLYDKVPTFLKNIITEDKLEHIAQWIFDWMRKYAEEYKAAQTSGEESADARIKMEATADLIAGLMGATISELKDLAIEKGVSEEGLKTKADFVKAIVLAMIETKA